MARRAKMIFVTIVAAGLGASCVFQGLRQDLEVMAQLGEISGPVIAAPETSCPIFVVLYRAESEKQVLYAYYLAYSSGAFRFVVPPGSYYLFAFEDRNEDAAFPFAPGWHPPRTRSTASGSGRELRCAGSHCRSSSRPLALPRVET